MAERISTPRLTLSWLNLGCANFLCSRKERLGQFGCECVEFCQAGGSRFKFFPLPYEPVAAVTSDAHCEIPSDQVGRAPKQREAARSDRTEQRGAAPFSYAHVTRVHWEGHNFESVSVKTLEDCNLLGTEVHDRNAETPQRWRQHGNCAQSQILDLRDSGGRRRKRTRK